MEESGTVTIITSLMDRSAYPARDIELIYLEEKQTLAGGQPVTAATPARAYRMAAATVAAHQAMRIADAGVLTTAIEITRRDITAHPLRFVTTRLHLLPLPAAPFPHEASAPPAA